MRQHGYHQLHVTIANEEEEKTIVFPAELCDLFQIDRNPILPKRVNFILVPACHRVTESESNSVFLCTEWITKKFNITLDEDFHKEDLARNLDLGLGTINMKSVIAFYVQKSLTLVIKITDPNTKLQLCPDINERMNLERNYVFKGPPSKGMSREWRCRSVKKDVTHTRLHSLPSSPSRTVLITSI